MAASQQSPEPEDEAEEGRRRWMEPDPAEVAEQIDFYRSMSKQEFAEAVAAFVVAGTRKKIPEDYEVQACALRSPQLARKVRAVLPALHQDPDKYMPVPEGESNNARRSRLGTFRSRVEIEDRLLHRVLAGDAARRGFFLPDPNPRGRARRRLAGEHPVRFLELLREERQADVERAEEERQRRREEARARRAGLRKDG
jgi:hypothetical protein